jgi:VCBS repeat-containing protein
LGTTNSFDNTPQATDDIFKVNEDTGLITLNVMANDLGGNAKTLYSIDDGTTSSGTIAPTDLLIKDSIGGNSDVSAKGARISITADGKVSYDLSTVAEFQKLAAGETAEDSFIYAIRLGNGTLSWAKAVIVVIGVNDVPQIVSVGTAATGAITELAGQTASSALGTASGKIAFADVDFSDTHTASVAAPVFNWSGGTLSADQTAALKAAGTLALTVSDSTSTGSGSVAWNYSAKDMAFDFLGKGQTLTVTYQVSVADNHGGSVIQNVVITVTGGNDKAVISDANVTQVKEDIDASSGALTATGKIAISDADAGEDHFNTAVVSAQGNLGTLTLKADGTYTYSVDNSKVQYLGANASKVDVFTVTAADGTTKDVSFTINGTNDGPVAVADTASGTENQTLTIDVLANDTDADDGHAFTLVSGSAPASKGTVPVANNQLVFTPGSDFDHLKAGATEQVTLSYTMKDDQGATSTSTVTVTVTGTNDAPVAVADTASGTENQA